MRETFPVKLLLQLLQATPEELVAIERFLGGHAFADRQPSMRPAALLAPQRPDRGRYALKKGQGAWALTYDGAQAAVLILGPAGSLRGLGGGVDGTVG
jgi:hypothetical protein